MTVDLGSLNGIPVRTFTNHAWRDGYPPAEKYQKVIRIGLKEAYPAMSEHEMEEYLQVCMSRSKGN